VFRRTASRFDLVLLNDLSRTELCLSQEVMNNQIDPKRIILRCREQYFQEQGKMIQAFFESQDLLNLEDYGVHICGEPSSPTIYYLVLDLHCGKIPSVNLSELEIQVFKVSKNNTLCVAFPTWMA
jgi:hypothetical protein